MRTRADFVARYGGVYEHSPWVAETVWDSGLAPEDPRALPDIMRLIVDKAGHARQLTLLRAHPDLAGKLAVAGALTAASSAEQAGAGLDRCTPEEFAEFQTLNETYKERFAFPFILAVKGHDRASILDIFRRRVKNNPETEFREALEQVHRIAGFRLAALDGEGA